MCCMGQFNRLDVLHLPVIDYGSACIFFLGLTQY